MGNTPRQSDLRAVRADVNDARVVDDELSPCSGRSCRWHGILLADRGGRIAARGYPSVFGLVVCGEGWLLEAGVDVVAFDLRYLYKVASALAGYG